ncbi:DUF1134 domain-containing protein [Solimonas sp. K1W22B-7]|uniref:DUF1134 domain-containing protein n=1 Tax=Solimonas sp. K1W22B-7 TaxID=2303331 RepID=UPI001F08FE82|nr:DUF1134 domain-containing protein [Solimonas sp. K1W22B-7]
MRSLILLPALVLLSACQSMEPISSAEAAAPGQVESAPVPETVVPADAPVSQETYTSEEVVAEASKFFGKASADVAQAVERVFARYGRPNAYIIGEEGSGALVVGLRYGRGTLQYKGGDSMPIYWQGPSVGWDWGGNASKVVTLVYNLRNTSQMFQRYPGVDGSLYLAAGIGVNYQQAGNVVLAPMRTGVGLRAGASVGYLSYTRKPSVIPF